MLDWQPYVLAPERPLQDPVGVVAVSGGVKDARDLVRREGPMTLRYKRGESAPVVVLDYGREVAGVPAFRVKDFKGRTELRSSYSETLTGLKADGDYAGRKRLSRVQVQPVKRSGLLFSDQVEGGQRYVRLTLTRPGRVRLTSAAIRYTAYRGVPDHLTGNFVSSDPQLNRIWYAGVYTLNLNQIPGEDPVLIDGGKRDRKVWSGDLLTAGPSVFYSLPTKYVRGALARLAAPRLVPIPGKCFPDGSDCLRYSAAYSMAWVIALRDYYRYTGDRAFVKPLLGLVQRQVRRDGTHVGPDGLFDVAFTRGKNWNLERFGGKLTYVNAMYVLELDAAAELLQAFGADPSALRAQAARVGAAVNAQLWDAQRGVYDVATARRGITVQDANVMAALSGLAPPDRAESALATIEEELSTPVGTSSVAEGAPEDFRPTVSPYMGGLQLQADFAAGRTAAALALMRREWGWMLRNDPGGTFWEKMGLNGRLGSFASAAHGWSTAPTALLSRYVLGAAPASAGWRTWSVAPQPGDVQWARGSVRAARSHLDVSWRRTKSGGFTMRVSAPRRTSGSVAVPLLGADRDVRRDGKRAASTVSGGYAVFAGHTGTHTYTW